MAVSTVPLQTDMDLRCHILVVVHIVVSENSLHKISLSEINIYWMDINI